MAAASGVSAALGASNGRGRGRFLRPESLARGATLANMLGPSRPLPRAGARARVKHFGGGTEDATVIAVAREGRLVRVRTADGWEREFVLSPKSARFVAADDAHGPRLELLE